jgi:hypothetical protein
MDKNNMIDISRCVCINLYINNMKIECQIVEIK